MELPPTAARRQMQERFDRLRSLRDEVRLELHLAGMEAKDLWQRLEPALDDAKRLADDVTEPSRLAMEELIEKVEKFRRTIARRENRQHH